MMREIDEIINRLSNDLDDFEVDRGASNEKIALIESEFNVTLPEDYKYFLSRYGYASWDGADILGVCSDSDLEKYFSMPFYTRDDRNTKLPSYFSPRPKNTVIVGAYGGGGHYFLHCENSQTPGKVELLLTELHGKAAKNKWNSFVEFLDHY